MFYDQNGRPDANGQFEMKGGKLARRASSVLQHGERIAFDLALMDAAPANNLFLTDSATKFTDAERSLADSAEGQMLITQRAHPIIARMPISATGHRPSRPNKQPA